MEHLSIDEMNEVWSALTLEERIFLRENSRLQPFKKSENLYREGSPSEYLYSIATGKVKIYKEGVAGRQQIIRVAEPGAVFSFRAFFANESHCVSAATIEPSMIYMVPLTIIRQIIESNNKLAISFMGILAKELGAAETRVVSLTQKHLRGRLAETLVLLIDTFGYDEDTQYIGNCLSREDLACFANMTASNAIRTLSNFDEEGIIAIEGKKIHVIDEPLLRRISKQG